MWDHSPRNVRRSGSTCRPRCEAACSAGRCRRRCSGLSPWSPGWSPSHGRWRCRMRWPRWTGPRSPRAVRGPSDMPCSCGSWVWLCAFCTWVCDGISVLLSVTVFAPSVSLAVSKSVSAAVIPDQHPAGGERGPGAVAEQRRRIGAHHGQEDGADRERLTTGGRGAPHRRKQVAHRECRALVAIDRRRHVHRRRGRRIRPRHKRRGRVARGAASIKGRRTA